MLINTSSDHNNYSDVIPESDVDSELELVGDEDKLSSSDSVLVCGGLVAGADCAAVQCKVWCKTHA